MRVCACASANACVWMHVCECGCRRAGGSVGVEEQGRMSWCGSAHMNVCVHVRMCVHVRVCVRPLERDQQNKSPEEIK